MSKTRDQINEWLAGIDVSGKTVLDVGAGSPRAWLFPPSEEGSPKVTGKPASYKNCDYDDQWGCDFHIDLNEPVEVKEQFDFVFCCETLEHIWSPLQAIETLSKFTKEKLFITVPFVYPIHDYHDYFRYTLQWFNLVLLKYGFKDIKISRRTSEDIKGFYDLEGMRMSKVTIRQGFGDNIRDIGYMIEAIK